MLDLEEELAGLIDALSDAEIDYALCGGLALAIHGAPRATIDIDLLVREQDLERVTGVARDQGFLIRAFPMTFSGGAMRIERVTKIDPRDGETLMLDLLLVTHASESVWAAREKRSWRGRDLSVVSVEGLIVLKRFRSSKQDLADIDRLQELQ